MKITKRQLRRIIREEIDYSIPGMDSTPYVRKMGVVLQDLADQGANQEELVLVLEGLISNVRESWYHDNVEDEQSGYYDHFDD